jgi:hypothetical protein
VSFVDTFSVVVPFFILAFGIGMFTNIARHAIARHRARRRARARGNGKILVVADPGASLPGYIATSVLVTYEGATINGVPGHRFTVLRWLDDRRLGGGWAPGPLSAAQREVIELCAREAWTQSRAVRS